MTIVDNFTNTEVVNQDNMHEIIFRIVPDTIVNGGTAEHIFEVPLDLDADVITFSILYNNGVETIIEKIKEDRESVSYEVFDNGTSIITCRLSVDDSLEFKWNRITKVQLKFVLLSGEIMYSEKYPVNVIATIDNK